MLNFLCFVLQVIRDNFVSGENILATINNNIKINQKKNIIHLFEN